MRLVFLLWTCTSGTEEGGLCIVAGCITSGQVARRHELFDKGQEDRDDDGRFDRLACRLIGYS